MNAFIEDTGVRRVIIASLGALSLLLLVSVGLQFKRFQFEGKDIWPQSTIIVAGTSERFVIPDTAEFSFSVIQEAKEFGVAQEAATKAVNDAIAFLVASDVDKADIKTTNYSINPRYEYDGVGLCTAYGCSRNERVLVGYEVNQTILVKTSNIDTTGDLVAGIGNLGISQISSVSFTVDEDDEIRREIRDEAIADARVEAKRIARALGVNLGRIMSYGNGNLSYARNAYGYGGDAMLSTAEMAKSPELPVGENRYSSNVSITFELR